MDRDDFIKMVSIGTGSFLFSGFGISPDVFRYDLKKVKIYENYARGVHFVRDSFFTTPLKEGDQLQLIREPDNKYDRFAIRIEKEGNAMGYVAAYENITLALLMDQGVQLEAIASQVDLELEEDMYLDKPFAVQVFTKVLVPFDHIDNSGVKNLPADDVIDRYRQG
jgi:hypothetical protein